MVSLRLFRSVIREELRTYWSIHRRAGILTLLFAGVLGVSGWSLMGQSRPMTAFVYTYGFGDGASLKAWSLDSIGHWHERGSDGREARLFDVTVRGAVDGCSGYLTHERSQPGYTFFVPDMGCRAKGLMLRRSDGDWSTLGPILVASDEPPRDP